MATVTHDDLLVCVDCAMMIANGEMAGDHTEAEAAAHAEAMAAQWQGVPGTLALDGLTDGDEAYGTAPCDGCGSHLHGARFSAVVIAP